MTPEPELELVVRSKAEAAEGVALLTLASAAGVPVPDWTPGAHLDLVLGPELVRQYSLCGDPADRSVLQVAVLKEDEGRGGSRHVHDVLQEGDIVWARAPRNHFALVDSPRYLFIAGGIGITPLLPMITAVEKAGAEWELLYGGRSRRTMAFADRLAAEHPFKVALHPQDEAGRLDLAGALATPRPDTAVYCCGPEPLLTAVERFCTSWPTGALHLERFVPRTFTDLPATEFTVELAQAGITLTVPADRSILEVVEDAGIPVLSSCQEGTCGSCETGVLKGTPDHRDSLLTPKERRTGDVMFICVSRSRSDHLILDL